MKPTKRPLARLIASQSNPFRSLTYLAAGLSLLPLASASSNASIVHTTGEVVVATPPSDISSNHWESNNQIRAIVERQSVTLPSAISADITSPGTSPSATDANLSPGTIAAGTAVNSYMLHFDVNGSLATQNAIEGSGSITFSDPILGLIALSTSLNDTNATLGLAGITYSSGSDHGLDFDPAGGGTSDIVTLSADRKTVTVDLRDASFADDLRIVTAVPEPSSLLLLAISALVIPARAPRRRRAMR